MQYRELGEVVSLEGFRNVSTESRMASDLVPADLPFVRFQGEDAGLPMYTLSVRDLVARASELDHRIVRPHKLGFFVILLVTEGEATHYVDFQAVPLRPGTLVFVRRGQVQQFDIADNLDGRLLVFTEAFLRRSLPGHDGFPVLRVLDPHSGPLRLDLDPQEKADVTGLIDQIEAETRRSGDGLEAAMASAALLRLFLTAERAHRALAVVSGVAAADLDRFLAFRANVDAHVRERWSVEQHAAALGVTARTLGTLSRRLTQQTPKQILDGRLALEVKRLLAHTDEPVSAIAYTVGFEEPTNLAKFFRRVEGTSPGTFRARAQGANE